MDKRLKETFCDLATQYYVAARLAAQARLVPVNGNLFHHAVEMYLKAALVETIPMQQMKKRKYSHNLTSLWKQFKAKEADPLLTHFDATIQALHEFESIRYRMRLSTGDAREHRLAIADAVKVTGSAKVLYEVIIAEIE